TSRGRQHQIAIWRDCGNELVAVGTGTQLQVLAHLRTLKEVAAMVRKAIESATARYGVVAVLLLAQGGAGRVALAEDEAAEPATTAAIHFSNGDYATGRLLNSHEAGVLRLQSGAFVGELAFPAEAVQSVEYKRVVDPKNAGPYFLEIAGGDTI